MDEKEIEEIKRKAAKIKRMGRNLTSYEIYLLDIIEELIEIIKSHKNNGAWGGNRTSTRPRQ